MHLLYIFKTTLDGFDARTFVVTLKSTKIDKINRYRLSQL